MPLSHLLVFAAAYLAVLVLPGPAITALVARVLGRGPRGCGFFIIGMAVGSLVWFTLAATGLAVLAATFAPVFVAVRYLGAAYLLYLAWKLWTAPVRPRDGAPAVPEGRGRLFMTGLAINLGNPKAVAFFLALLPTVVDLHGLTPTGFVELAGTIVALVFAVGSSYVLAATRARRLFASPRAMRVANRGSGAVMAGAAVVIAAR